MNWIGRLFVIAAFVCLLSPSAGAQPKQTQTVQVLTVFSNTAYEQAESLSVALKRAVDRTKGWSLGKGDFSLEVLTAALGCKETPDQACLKKIAERVKSEQFVWGSIEKKGSNVTGTLHLYSAGPGKETQVNYSENLSDASDEVLLKIAETAFAELVGLAPGKLVISTTNAKTVRVDDESPTPLSVGRNELDLPGGDHKLTFSGAGFADQVREVTIVSGEQAQLEISLAANPGGSVEGGGVVDTGRPMSGQKIAGVAAMGVGGALLVGALYSAIKVNSINNDEGFDRYRSSVSQGDDVCDQADAGKSYIGAPSPSDISDKCSSAATFQTLQWVFVGVGALATGVGAYLFFTDKDEAPKASSRPRMDTAVGPTGGRVQLTWAF